MSPVTASGAGRAVTIAERERLGYRMPLALRCRAATTGRPVGDGLVAVAWPAEDPATTAAAVLSPVSATLGFGALAGLSSAATRGFAPAGQPIAWPAVVPRRYVVRVLDAARPGRYLPTVLALDVPAPAPVVVDLYDAPTAPASSGWASVVGEVRRTGATSGISHAVVEVAADGTTYRGVADEAGRFALHIPYPEALPPLGAGPAAVPSWPVAIAVRAQPGSLARAPGTTGSDPPTQASILSQATAIIRLGAPQPSITQTLRLHEALVLILPVDPA